MPDIVLITGANGLLGKRAVDFFSKNNQVHALSHRESEDRVEGVEYHVVDFSTQWETLRLPTKVDVIIHLAQSSNFRNFPDQALDVFNVNIASTARLLDYGRSVGCKHFVYASSGGIYESGASLVDENSPIVSHGQLGYYLASKLCGELLVRSYVSTMSVSVLRFFFIYGKEQRRSMLLPRLVDNVRAGNPIQLQGEEGIVINPVHVSDAVRALGYVLGSPGSNTFNVAGIEPVSLKKLAEQIGKILHIDPVFEHVGGEPTRLVADITAIGNLGWAPSVTLLEGINELVI
jgi:nucleoside-diphosphate-sugar epimerase